MRLPLPAVPEPQLSNRGSPESGPVHPGPGAAQYALYGCWTPTMFEHTLCSIRLSAVTGEFPPTSTHEDALSMTLA
jgi:hypothetical protein